MKADNRQSEFVYQRYATLHTGAKEGPLYKYSVAARDFNWRLRDLLPQDKRVRCLDVACGAGELLYYLKQQGFSNVTGIDISGEQVRLAQQVCKEVCKADAEQFLDANKGYGLVTVFSYIEHLDRVRAFALLRRVYGALEPGGKVIILTPNADSPFASHMRYGDLTHETIYNRISMRTLLKSCGFENIVTRECGPVPHGIRSGVRWVLWQSIKLLLKGYRMIEGGSSQDWIFTTEFIVVADKPVQVSGSSSDTN